MARLLIIVGISLVVLGLLFSFFGRLGIGKLPGDLVYRRGNFTLYFPLMTSILLSLILSGILWLFRR